MNKAIENVIILIPAYEPSNRLVAYVDRLHDEGFNRVVVVDDGSGGGFCSVFAALEEMAHCVVLRHEVNRGKGAALKTGYEFISRRFPDAAGILTADADGQHTPEDCRRLGEALMESPDALYLGCRDFSLPGIPFRSRFGNRMTSALFGLLYGRWIGDTQTGLRAFPLSEVPFMMAQAGDRFEYEMGVLTAVARSRFPIRVLPIRTIYEDGNSCSHFRPVRDALRIYGLICGQFLRFTGISIASFLLDQGLAWAFAVFLNMREVRSAGIIWGSGFAARFISSIFNYTLNRSVVFGGKSRVAASAWRYAALCVLVIVMSNAGVWGLCALGMQRGPAKLLCDCLLYFVGYRIQQKWVF